jgi:hypothetical protein
MPEYFNRHTSRPRKGGIMTDNRHEENLLVVVAVEEYARRYGISAYETLNLFLKFGITESIRQCYNTLHTHDIYECVSFAEDILKRKNI